ncbi:type II toxin-antitoxin system Phd/YefM family antitoxin [Bradyrhizobium sp.]|jgi:prevent-host-death family protein
MKHVGIFEAKTHLSALLDEVEKGGEVTITRHGKPVAKLVQATAEFSPEEIERRRQAIARLRANARRINLNVSHEEIKAWIEDGRH